MKILLPPGLRKALLCLSLTVVGPWLGKADTRTWTGAVSTQWSDAGNWSPAGVPASSDTVVFSGSKIDFATPVTFSGQFNWAGGTLGGGLTIGVGGAMTISGGADKLLTGALTNQGTVTWQDNGRIVVSDSHWYNAPGSLFLIQNDQPYFWTTGKPTFLNEGTVWKVGGSGTTYFGLPFNNAGLVRIDQGTIGFGTGWSCVGGELNLGLHSRTNYGRASFTGPLPQLWGTLGATLLDRFQPQAGESFQVITFEVSSGPVINASFDFPPEAAWAIRLGGDYLRLVVLNARPTLHVSDATVAQGGTLSLPITVSDPDPGQTFTFALVSGPEGASVDPASGLLTWSPRAVGTSQLTVSATDSGTPALTGQLSFNVTVLPSPFLSINLAGNTALVQWPVLTNAYVLEATTNLAPPLAWTFILNTKATSPGATQFADDVSSGVRKFYRLRQP